MVKKVINCLDIARFKAERISMVLPEEIIVPNIYAQSNFFF